MPEKKFRPLMTEKQKKEKEKREAKMEKSGMVMEMDDSYWPERVRFSDDALPEIDSWEVGKEYTLSIIVKMKDYSAKDKPGKNCASFEILGVKAADGSLNAEQKKIVDFMVGDKEDK